MAAWDSRSETRDPLDVLIEREAHTCAGCIHKGYLWGAAICLKLNKLADKRCERDKDQPCICCGRFASSDDWTPGGTWDAGHFLGRGAYPELRFEETNCHKQLKTCNGGSGKYAKKGRTVSQGYREGLIDRIGVDRVEWLKGPHEPKHYTIEDLKVIKALYVAKLKELKRERSI